MTGTRSARSSSALARSRWKYRPLGQFPPALTEQLTVDQQAELRSKVAKILAQRTSVAQRQILRGAIQSVHELANAVQAGLVVDDDSATTIRSALDRALGALVAPDLRTVTPRNPSQVILDGINAWIDAHQAGEVIDAGVKEELEMGIELVLELLRGRRTVASAL